MKCPECGKELSEVTPKHAQTYGMTMQQMRQKYSELIGKNFSYGRARQIEKDKPRPTRRSERRII